MLVLGETLDPGGVEHVPHRLVAERIRHGPGIGLEHRNLPKGEVVFGRILCRCQMGINALDAHLTVLPQEIQQSRQFSGHKAEPVHAGVQLDVDGEVLQAAAAKFFAQRLQGVEVGDARLQPVVDDLGEEIRPGGEHEDRQGDTVAAQLHTLDRQGHGEIVGAFLLQHRGELHGPVAVGVGLDEHQQFRGRLQPAAEVAVVVPARGQAQLQARKIVFPVHTIYKYNDFLSHSCYLCLI